MKLWLGLGFGFRVMVTSELVLGYYSEGVRVSVQCLS